MVEKSQHKSCKFIETNATKAAKYKTKNLVSSNSSCYISSITFTFIYILTTKLIIPFMFLNLPVLSNLISSCTGVY